MAYWLSATARSSAILAEVGRPDLDKPGQPEPDQLR